MLDVANIVLTSIFAAEMVKHLSNRSVQSISTCLYCCLHRCRLLGDEGDGIWSSRLCQRSVQHFRFYRRHHQVRVTGLFAHCLCLCCCVFRWLSQCFGVGYREWQRRLCASNLPFASRFQTRSDFCLLFLLVWFSMCSMIDLYSVCCLVQRAIFAVCKFYCQLCSTPSPKFFTCSSLFVLFFRIELFVFFLLSCRTLLLVLFVFMFGCLGVQLLADKFDETQTATRLVVFLCLYRLFFSLDAIDC